MAGVPANSPVRGTQLLVEHMGSVFGRPSLVAIEIAWRWLFCIPFLLVCWSRVQRILAAVPLESSAAASLDTQNPWVAAGQLYSAASFYEPHVLAVLRWLLPLAALVWIALSGLGRHILLTRIAADRCPRLASRLLSIVVLQSVWLALFAAAFWGWLNCMSWDATLHIAGCIEPDLVGYAVWAIFLSLGFFTAFALVSWIASIAPLIAVLEDRSALSALAQSLRLGRAFTGKLVEINLVLGIVKLALVVVAMVFSAAPLPFSDELGPGALHLVAAASVVFFFVADDFFQVVRLKAFAEFWKIYRGS
ncbi:MAG: hypothetical protein ACLQG3_09745 [Terracidiphilus sp.]